MNLILQQLSDGSPQLLPDLASISGYSVEEIRSELELLIQEGVKIDLQANQVQWRSVPDLLSSETISGLLSTHAASSIGSIRIENHLASTNSTLQQQFTPGQVLLAEHQTAGRGRLGRSWYSPFARNIYLSIGWTFDLQLPDLAGLSLATGMAIAEALTPYLNIPILLKWPNDLYLDQRKLGGVLIELSQQPGAGASAVIGIGINVAMQQAEKIDQPWISLNPHLKRTMNRNQITAAILNSLIPGLQQFADFRQTQLHQRWQQFDLTQGANVTVITETHAINGVGAGIDEQFRFLLQTPQGLQTFSSADVKLRLL